MTNTSTATPTQLMDIAYIPTARVLALAAAARRVATNQTTETDEPALRNMTDTDRLIYAQALKHA